MSRSVKNFLIEVGVCCLGFVILLIVISCANKSQAEYVYETMVLVDTENSNKVKDMYSFNPAQVEMIKEVNPYIPERAEITFVDRKGFVYFTLGKSSFAVQLVYFSGGAKSVIVYPLDGKRR